MKRITETMYQRYGFKAKLKGRWRRFYVDAKVRVNDISIYLGCFINKRIACQVVAEYETRSYR